jgi:hypothetical protein
MSKRQPTTKEPSAGEVESYLSFLDDFMGDEQAFRRFTNWVTCIASLSVPCHFEF